MFNAGRLRHRVNIQKPVQAQDPDTGEVTRTWSTVFADVPASIEPMSVREFIAAQQMVAQCTTMIVFRWLPGLTPTMRIVQGATIYNPAGFLADKESGAEYVTAPCTVGTNEG